MGTTVRHFRATQQDPSLVCPLHWHQKGQKLLSSSQRGKDREHRSTLLLSKCAHHLWGSGEGRGDILK